MYLLQMVHGHGTRCQRGYVGTSVLPLQASEAEAVRFPELPELFLILAIPAAIFPRARTLAIQPAGQTDVCPAPAGPATRPRPPHSNYHHSI